MPKPKKEKVEVLDTEDAWSAKDLHRVKRLSDFINQPGVDVIRGQIESGKVSRSYLITGERGDGKSTLARLIARKINNTKNDKHPNIHYVKGTVASGIDDVRALLETLRYQPLEKGKKVIIIEECFPANTKIMLANGSTETIETITKNPTKYSVMTFNETSREIEAKPVLKGLKKNTNKLLEITLSDGSIQRVTPNHRFWSVDRKDWVEASNLNEGETLMALKPILA